MIQINAALFVVHDNLAQTFSQPAFSTMILHDEDINNSVLGVFMEMSIPPMGRLSYGTLREEWPKYQLRAADLDKGLQQLLARGDLEKRMENGATHFLLTPQGYQFGRSQETLAHMAQSLWTRLKEKLWPQPQTYGRLGERHSRPHYSTDRTRMSDPT